MKRKTTIVLALISMFITGSVSTYILLGQRNGNTSSQESTTSTPRNSSKPEESATPNKTEESKFNNTLSVNIVTKDPSQVEKIEGQAYNSTSTDITITKGQIDSVLNYGSKPNYDKSKISIRYDSEIFAFKPQGGTSSIKIDGVDQIIIGESKVEVKEITKQDGIIETSFIGFSPIKEKFQFNMNELVTQDFFTNFNNNSVEKFNQRTNNGQNIDYSSIVISASFYYDNDSKVVKYEIKYNQKGDAYVSTISTEAA